MMDRFYTDGSRIDDEHDDFMKLGWAFAVIGKCNEVLAIASGTPPEWIVDIPGAEAWALFQAAMHSDPGSDFRSDCKPCVDSIGWGRRSACSAKRPLARVMNMIFNAMDDADEGAVVWMPAHTAAHDVGNKCLGNGQKLTLTDRRANNVADTHAKLAAQ